MNSESDGMIAFDTTINTSTDSTCLDCSRFLNWDEEESESYRERAVIFRSLVATVKLKPALDDSLEEKAVKFLTSVDPEDDFSADAFFTNLASPSDDSSTVFVQCIVIILSSPNQVITTAAMKMVDSLIATISPEVLLALVEADQIPQLVISLNPLSLPFAEAVDIHVNLMKVITNTLWLSTPDGLEQLEIEYGNEQQAVPETILQQVLTPSEKYIWHLCVNRFSIIERLQSKYFLELLATLLRICAYFQRTMKFFLDMPVLLTIPNCLSFIEAERSTYSFLNEMSNTQRQWNKTRGAQRQMWKTIQREFRMEGIEDVMEEKLQNNEHEYDGDRIVDRSITWNNQLGVNLPEQQ
ncbi:hypothetical protein BLNAU_23578 [Blattamonas nauphoetae]|uniref:Uncharacterized protein n=1 Tax=Blattamonas nauphoetae TaxID=2049346 RepID=A0ABQ9WPU8_9EUKA|nr:hypothetical protein BLNAU_23578 [Blattamonas nauphoetae]